MRHLNLKVAGRRPFRDFRQLPVGEQLGQTERGWGETEDVLIRPLDVTQNEDHEKLVQESVEKWGGVDLLVNNAGYGYRATVDDERPNVSPEPIGSGPWRSRDRSSR